MAVQKIKFWNTKNQMVIWHIAFYMESGFWCIHDLCEAWLLHEMKCESHELRCVPPMGYREITVVDEEGTLIHGITE